MFCRGNRFSSCPKSPESGTYPTAYPADSRGSFPGYRAAGGMSWPLNLAQRLKCMQPYLFYPICLMVYCLFSYWGTFTLTVNSYSVQYEQRPSCEPLPVHVVFMVDKVALGQAFFQVLWLFPVIIPWMCRTHLFICHWW
jgi:hypothetical protein